MAANTGNKFRPIGDDTVFKSPTEGHDATGSQVNIVRDEFPLRIDIVSDELYYIGWAVLGASETSPEWKIRRIVKSGNVWNIGFAFGNQYYRYKWSDRASLPYA